MGRRSRPGSMLLTALILLALCSPAAFGVYVEPATGHDSFTAVVSDEPPHIAISERANSAFHPGRILVKPKRNVPPRKLAELHAKHGGKVKKAFPRIGGLQVVELSKGASVRNAIEKYRKSGLVEYAEPDYRRQVSATFPDDALFSQLWQLNNTGQSGGTVDADIDAPEAWDILHDMPEIIVAVTDTGVRYTHEDLAANMWVNPGEIAANQVDDDGNGFVDDIYGVNTITGTGDPMDDHGHGTHVSGTIGAVGNNGKGTVGIAWRVRIMACKFITSDGYGYDSDAIECIDYARRMGAHVMSNSWGSSEFSQPLYDAIAVARDAGIAFVAAAGNDGGDTDVSPQYPASYDLSNVVSVAATDRYDALPPWSNFGAESVDLGAPGLAITSTYALSDTSYTGMSGTSMATPHVAGALAMLKAAHPDESYPQLIVRLLSSVDHLSALEGKCRTEGRLNLYNALTHVPPDLYVTPADDLSFGGMPGGSYSPPQAFTLSNFTAQGLDWSASGDQTWTTISPSSGTIGPKGSVSVSVSINQYADSLPNGMHTANITFTNESGGTGATTRNIMLNLGQLHVKADAPGPEHDGISWNTAFLTVGDAMQSARAGQEVWVAEGTYTESIALSLGVGLYGGFAGNETSRDQRDWQAHVTILDGEGDTVVMSPHLAGPDTRLDGFTVRNGGGWYGAIACMSSSPTIANNIVIDSFPSAIHSQSASPHIANNLLTNNSVGITCLSGSPVIENNVLRGNVEGIYCDDSSPNLACNMVVGNGFCGLFCESGAPRIINNTVAAGYYGVHCEMGNPRVENNIIALNQIGVDNVEGILAMSLNDVYGNRTNYSGVSPGFGDISEDPMFADSDLGDFHIQPGSPCIDAAYDPGVGLPATDIDGEPRTQGSALDMGADESDGEARTVNPRIIYVNVSAPLGGDGASWGTAYRKIEEAAADSMIECGTEIWVAQGVYYESVQLRPFTHLYGGFAGTESERAQRDWRLNRTTVSGTPQSGSTITAGPRTTVDGFTVRFGSTAVSCVTSTATVRNNTITGSSGNGIVSTYGASTIAANTINGNHQNGVLCQNDACTVAGNVIVGNASGVNCSSSLATVTANTIAGNAVEGIYSFASSPTITGNIAAYNHIGVYAEDGAPVLSHNDVYGNFTDYSGVEPGGGDISQNPRFACYEVGDLHIQPDSPCRDAGDNSAPGLPALDMDGQDRIQDGTVDIGADESDGTTWPSLLRVIHVDASAAPGGDGAQWVSAYQTIGPALTDISQNGGAQVWVARGTYNERLVMPQFAHLYGGFAGGESSREQRNPKTNVTVINGGDPNLEVVIAANVSTVDGFTIRNGRNGIVCDYVSPTIANNVITGNTGDGIYCSFGNPLLIGNLVTGNPTDAIHVYTCSPVIMNNTLRGSRYGLYASYGSPVVSGNVMIGNTMAGVYCDTSSPTVSNNTIVGCGYGVQGAGNSSPQLTNNIVAFNWTGIAGGAGTPVLARNNVYGNSRDYSGIDPGATDISADPMLACYKVGDAHIQPGSPCRNAGTNSAPGLPALDIDGQSRIQEDAVDIGADESDGTTWPSSPRVIYVDASADPGGNGSEWSSAYRTIGAALTDVSQNSGAEVWVARGTYSERLVMPLFSHVYGGFAGGETEKSQKDSRLNRTVVDGGGSGNVFTGVNVSTIDGFVIRNGYRGVDCGFSSPVIANNTLIRNTNEAVYCANSFATIWGNHMARNRYGVYCSAASPDIVGNRMIGNYHGVYCSSATPTIASNVIAANNASGIYCTYSSPTVTNNTIVGAYAGIYCYYNSNPSVTGNIIAFNNWGINRYAGSPVLSFNDVYGNRDDYLGIEPGPGDITGDPQFASYEFGDFHIAPGSPCRNAGSNSASRLPSVDIDGQPRVQDGTADIGADESDGTDLPAVSPRVIHVDASAPAGGDGADWAHAYKTIQAGLDDALLGPGADMWVARGTYPERISLSPFAHLYGGFTGAETQRSQRNFSSNVCTVDGGGSGYVVTGANVSTLDGFRITGGQYGIYCTYTSPAIRNNKVTGNASVGIASYYGFSSISSNLITGNASGGIYCASGSQVVTGNTLAANASAGVSCASGSPLVANNIVAFNVTGIAGPGTPSLMRNDVYGNTTDYLNLTPGPSDLRVDPVFRDRISGDYHLADSSPCIDAGMSDAPGLGDLDCDGEGRLFGAAVDVGADEYWSPVMSIADAKRAADGARLAGSGAVVTAAFDGYFYVEADDRSNGIRVNRPGHGLAEGMRASIVGALATSADAEKCIEATAANPDGEGSVNPLGLANHLLGGRDFLYKWSTGAGQRGVLDGHGLNNIGLLVKTWGYVTARDANTPPAWLRIDDGSFANLKIVLPPGVVVDVAQGDFIAVTGISSCERVGCDLLPLLRVRKASDVQKP